MHVFRHYRCGEQVVIGRVTLLNVLQNHNDFIGRKLSVFKPESNEIR